MSDDNKWNRPDSPPPPLFLGKKERDLVKQVNDELIERVIGQDILYYPISVEHTNFHPIYGEAIEKNFLPPIRVYVLIDWQGNESQSTKYGMDRSYNLFVREGDFILYDDEYYEITTLNEPKQLFGQREHMLEISAKCRKARQGLFDGR
jgi:hypothetical protein